jgi:hypothetical protein
MDEVRQVTAGSGAWSRGSNASCSRGETRLEELHALVASGGDGDDDLLRV